MKTSGSLQTTVEVAAMSLRRHRALLLVFWDVACIGGGYALATSARYGRDGSQMPLRWAALLAAIAILVHLFGGQLLQFHRGRSAVGSVEDTALLAAVSLAGAVAVELGNVGGHRILIARSIPFAAALAALGGMVLLRSVWRICVTGVGATYSEVAERALIVGAGNAADQLVWSMRTPDSQFVPVALLDDDRLLGRRRIHGVRVRGATTDLVSVAAQSRAQVVIVAIPSASGKLLGEVQELAAEAGLPVKVLPSVAELLEAPVTIRDVRDINLFDVLGRKPIVTDIESIAHILKGKRVLVTGAGGSIGSELCRQIHRWGPSEMVMLDRDESALHGVQLSIRGHGLLDSDEMVLCDIRDSGALDQIFRQRRPEVVFHAAALKHLPMLEQYPAEAIKTNVLGTVNVLEAAKAADVKLFVNISTDKAADPTSALGLSKRVAERVTADIAEEATGTYISVRFGNVLGSRGSVLTAWTHQIANGGPITVTHPDVTRYFMTIAEACQLVIQAGAIGGDGEVLILDMGEPVKLNDVAKQLIAQSGKNIKIVYTGLRPGEKMDETLIADGERDARPFHHLITHVPVMPLRRFPVASAAVPGERQAARMRLVEWVEWVEWVESEPALVLNQSLQGAVNSEDRWKVRGDYSRPGRARPLNRS